MNNTNSTNNEDIINKIKSSINNINNKNNKVFFILPDISTPSSSIYEIFIHANVVKDLGYSVILLCENKNTDNYNWIESNLIDNVEIISFDSKLTVSFEDIIVIPEIYSNIMEQVKDLPCMKVGFLQSIDYMVNSLLPGYNWNLFGIEEIITNSKTVGDLFKEYYSGNYNINNYNIGIPEYFKNDKNVSLKKPIFSIVGRNNNEISKFIKLFYAKYPEFNWVGFDPMLTNSKPQQYMRRIDFANRLKENFAAIWIDRISSFGTFPLECMKSNTIPICLKPDITPDYIVNRDENGKPISYKDGNDIIGVWVDEFYDLPYVAKEILVKFLDDSIDNKIYDNMYEFVSSEYNQNRSKNEISEIYVKLINKRLEILNNNI